MQTILVHKAGLVSSVDDEGMASKSLIEHIVTLRFDAKYA